MRRLQMLGGDRQKFRLHRSLLRTYITLDTIRALTNLVCTKTIRAQTVTLFLSFGCDETLIEGIKENWAEPWVTCCGRHVGGLLTRCGLSASC